MFSAARNGNWKGFATSTVGYLMGAMAIWGKLAVFNPWVLGGIAALAAAGWLAGKLGHVQERKLDAAHGDVDSTPWYSMLPSGQNIFMIATGAALLGLGINLSSTGAPYYSIPVNSVADLQTVRNGLYASIYDKDRPRLAAPAQSVLGKAFIQSSGNNGLTPDKVVFVTPDGQQGYNLNMETLDYKGYVVGKVTPGTQRVAFFEVDSTGNVNPTKDGELTVAIHTAMAQAAAGDVSAQSRLAALTKATVATNPETCVDNGYGCQ